MLNQVRLLSFKILLILSIPMVCFTNRPGLLKTAPTASPEPTATVAPLAESAPEYSDDPITFGMSTEKNYYNPYFDIQLNLDNSWFVTKTLQLDEANGFSAEVPQEKRTEQYLDVLAQGKAVRDFYAQSNTGLMEIDINVIKREADDKGDQNLAKYHEEYATTMRELMRQSGAEIESENLTVALIAGQERSCLVYTYDYQGYTVHCAHVLIPSDDYLMSLFVSSIERDHVQELLALFSSHA